MHYSSTVAAYRSVTQLLDPNLIDATLQAWTFVCLDLIRLQLQMTLSSQRLFRRVSLQQQEALSA